MIERAHVAARAGTVGATDDAALCERSAMPVIVVRGSERALKVTEEADFARVEALSLLRGVTARSAEAAARSPFWSPAEIEAALRRDDRAPAASGGVLAYPTETVYGFGTAVDHDVGRGARAA